MGEREIQRVVSQYPMCINPYYLGLIKKQGDGLYKQAVPDIREITEKDGFEDPLNEEELSRIPGLTHKYPDRVLFLVSSRCAMYCRFCNRKRKVGNPAMVTKQSIREGPHDQARRHQRREHGLHPAVSLDVVDAIAPDGRDPTEVEDGHGRDRQYRTRGLPE